MIRDNAFATIMNNPLTFLAASTMGLGVSTAQYCVVPYVLFIHCLVYILFTLMYLN
jgi:hypothetical protein